MYFHVRDVLPGGLVCLLRASRDVFCPWMRSIFVMYEGVGAGEGKEEPFRATEHIHVGQADSSVDDCEVPADSSRSCCEV